MPTICVVLTNAAHQDWEIKHIDVKSAYLNAIKGSNIHETSERSPETRPRREGAETIERSIWLETSWQRMVYGNVQSLYERTRVQKIWY